MPTATDNASEIEVDLTNAGVFPEASGDAKFEARDDRTEFSVEIEDVPAGNYDLKVGAPRLATFMRPWTRMAKSAVRLNFGIR